MPPAIAGGLHPGFGGGDVPGLTNLHRSHPSTRVPFLALHTLLCVVFAAVFCGALATGG